MPGIRVLPCLGNPQFRFAIAARTAGGSSAKCGNGYLPATKSAKTKRFPVWENTRLIRARNREQAYRKAMKLANVGMPSKTDGGEWQFEGISLLLPIYEELVDGAEILWTDHGSIGLAKLKKLVKSKRELTSND